MIKRSVFCEESKLNARINAMVLIACMGSLTPSPAAAAGLTVAEVLEALEGTSDARSVGELYLKGIADGMLFMNSALSLQGKEPLYCQPSGLAIGVEQSIDIFKRFAEKRDIGNGMPAAAMVLAHQELFPCSD